MADIKNMSKRAFWRWLCAEYHRHRRQTPAEIEAELDAVEAEPMSDEQIDRIMASVMAKIHAVKTDTTATTKRVDT